MVRGRAPKAKNVVPKKYGTQTVERIAELYETEERYAEYEAKLSDETQKGQWRKTDFKYYERYIMFKDRTLIDIHRKRVVTRFNQNGYWAVNIWNDALQKWQWVLEHRLMGFCFLPIPDDGQVYDTIDHINFYDTLNNDLSNLRWATRHMQRMNQRKHNRQCKAVIQLDDSGTVIETYRSCHEAAMKLFCEDPEDDEYINPNDKREVRRKSEKIRSVIRYRSKFFGFYFEYFKYIDKEGEIWRDAIFEHCEVTISNFGNKRSKNGMVSKGTLYSTGYYRMKLKNIKTGEYETKNVNRIVWSVFSEKEIPPGMFIDHIIEDKSDNRFENLQVLTPGENTKKAARERAGAAKGTANDMGVYRLNLDGTFASKDKDGNKMKYEFNSMIMGSEATGSCVKTISALCNLLDQHFTLDGFFWIKRKDFSEENVRYLVQRYQTAINKHMVYSISFDGKKIVRHNSVNAGISYAGDGTNRRAVLWQALNGQRNSALNHVWIKYEEYSEDLVTKRLAKLKGKQLTFKCECCH